MTDIVRFFFDMMRSCRTYPVKLKNRMESENITFKELSNALIEETNHKKSSVEKILKDILYEDKDPTDGIKRSIENAIDNCLKIKVNSKNDNQVETKIRD